MKRKIFYLKIVILMLIVIDAVSFNELSAKDNSELCYLEENKNYVLVEKNIISKSFVSYLYKDDSDNFLSKIHD